MAAAKTSRAKPASLHDTILRDVQGKILKGTWPPGHRIPFETDMALHYGCSRMTVNKVLTQLTESGFLERKRKLGTVVRVPVIQSAVLEITDIEREITTLGRDYSYRLIARNSHKASTEERTLLCLKASAVPRTVLALDCLHYADGQPFCVEERLINPRAVPAAKTADFSDVPPGGWLLKQVPWSTARHQITAVGASAKLAARLGIKRGTACLVVSRYTELNGVPVTFVRLSYPGDKHQLVAQFTPPAH
ncbi:MAG: UTRA domain-containing protein [Rhizomicrobium sp.]